MATLANYRWQPTTTRLVTIDGCGPLPRGTLQPSPQILTWPAKDPGDTLDYVVDYSEILAGDSGDAIATLDVELLPNQTGDVALTTSDADGSQAVLWMTGGQSGTTYSVTVTVTTTSGRGIVRTVYLPVVALSVQTSAEATLTDQDGAPLTDQTDAPITV